MKWILRILVIIVALIAIMFAIGFALPAHTTHTRTVQLKQPPEKVFAVLADIPNLPKWNRNMEKVEVLAPIDGKATLATARFRLATAATRIRVASTSPARAGAPLLPRASRRFPSPAPSSAPILLLGPSRILRHPHAGCIVRNG